MSIEEKIKKGEIMACLACKKVFYTKNPNQLETPQELKHLKFKDLKWYSYHHQCFELNYCQKKEKQPIKISDK